jgi:hypothetical protein
MVMMEMITTGILGLLEKQSLRVPKLGLHLTAIKMLTWHFQKKFRKESVGQGKEEDQLCGPKGKVGEEVIRDKI